MSNMKSTEITGWPLIIVDMVEVALAEALFFKLYVSFSG